MSSDSCKTNTRCKLSQRIRSKTPKTGQRARLPPPLSTAAMSALRTLLLQLGQRSTLPGQRQNDCYWGRGRGMLDTPRACQVAKHTNHTLNLFLAKLQHAPQSLIEVDPVVRVTVLPGQRVHDRTLPADGLYVLTGHGAQSPSCTNCPAGHARTETANVTWCTENFGGSRIEVRGRDNLSRGEGGESPILNSSTGAQCRLVHLRCK